VRYFAFREMDDVKMQATEINARGQTDACLTALRSQGQTLCIAFQLRFIFSPGLPRAYNTSSFQLLTQPV
jgi:hypothetical protein